MNNRFYIREFLNKPGFHSVGYILCSVEQTDKEESLPGYAQLMIGDCNRHISIDIDIATEEDRDNTLYKLDLLIDSLNKFKEAILVEMDNQIHREQNPKEKGKLSLKELREKLNAKEEIQSSGDNTAV
jgi:hypothetical protein